jgi:diadenylate cyclase
MSLREVLDLLSWRDLVDVLIVGVLFYNLLLLIRGTRSVQMLIGLFFVAGGYYVARLAGLVAVSTLIEKFLIILPFALVVLFAPEIRRALANFGRGPFFGLGGGRQLDAILPEVVRAATTLAARRTGALVVFERQEGLRNYIENGVALDAVLSFDLLVSIFTPDTPLHDGAVIVSGGRVAAAACFLPLTSNPSLAKEFGSRHRAALGISEETDSVALVVSEENGEISVAVGGDLRRSLDGPGLAYELRRTLLALALGESRRAREVEA